MVTSDWYGCICIDSVFYLVSCLPTDTLVLEPIGSEVVLQSGTEVAVEVAVEVEVVPSSGAAALYSVNVPKGSSLLEALKLLKSGNVGFT